GGEAHLGQPGPLEELHQQEPGPGPALDLHDLVERVDPLPRLLRIGVGQLVREAVEDHGLHRRAVPAPSCTTPGCRMGPRCTPTAPASVIPAAEGGRGPCPAGASAAAPPATPPTSAWRSPP